RFARHPSSPVGEWRLSRHSPTQAGPSAPRAGKRSGARGAGRAASGGSPVPWGREDSNLRRLSRRVYSPFPLAARAHPRGGRIVALSPMEEFDVAIVGAGPAGSVAAYHLADAGAR